MRVISGAFRGRRLEAPRGRGTRPMLDSQKEALFNIISASFPCGGALDLFAGSGGLGIEALSRGAHRCTFVESGRSALEVLDRNLRTLDLGERTRILRVDACRLEADRIDHPWGVVFCDPPFRLALERPQRLAGLLARIAASDLLEPDALIMLRIPVKDAPEPEVAGLLVCERRAMGESRLLLYRQSGVGS